jgi:hypothetical protein
MDIVYTLNSSIFVPRMSIDYDEQFIRELMQTLYIGEVSWVDFSPINKNKKNGFFEPKHPTTKSAFIHFSSINQYNKIWQKIENLQSYKLYVDKDEYWILLKNKRPIQRTMLNIHQVVANCYYLENKINILENNLVELSDFLKKLQQNQLENVDSIQSVSTDLKNLRDDLEIYHIL